jgi:hypothetical protein
MGGRTVSSFFFLGDNYDAFAMPLVSLRALALAALLALARGAAIAAPRLASTPTRSRPSS